MQQKLGVLLITVAITASVINLPANRVLAADACGPANIRWAGSSNRAYVSGNVECTLTDIKTHGNSNIPLTLVDANAKIWLLEANILLQNGAALLLHGDAIGGDVNELRLKSSNTNSNFVWIKADYGKIDIKNTKVTSWDKDINGPDTEYMAYGRAFINVRSRLNADGTTKEESRMDIANSEVAYLGYQGAEAYGLTWKVLGSSLGIFDKVGVYGDIVNSNIHHNHFGAYTFGAESMKFTNNEVHHNNLYGIDPHDDSDYLLISGNNVYNNGKHGIICSKRCNDITIIENDSSNNSGVGIMLHRGVTNSTVSNNQTNNNQDSGLALFDSDNNTVSNNIAKFNQNGLRLSVGSANNTIDSNELSNNVKQGVFTYKGTDAPTGDNGRVQKNIFSNNILKSNGFTAMKIKEADDNLIQNNSIEGSKYGLYIIASTLIKVLNNNLLNNYFAGVGVYNSDKTTIADNTIKNTTTTGKYGIYSENSTNNDFSNNTISGYSIKIKIN